MHRYLPSYLFFVLLFGIVIPLLPNSGLYAAQLPILSPTAKQRPAQATRPPQKTNKTTQSSTDWISLGQAKDISSIKKYVGKAVPKRVSLSKIQKQISSKSAIVMNARNGDIIFSKSPDSPRQPASTIKVLTGMIALKSLVKTDLVDVSRKAARMPSSKIYLNPKKRYQVNDLINAVLLASANDASVALAEKIAGTEADFAKMMTLRAKLWGATRTICRTASGLTAKGQQSTARDLANIFRHAMQYQEFAQIMRRRKAQTSYGQPLYNHNKALWRIKGAEGGKTGYTAAARQTYVGQFNRDGETIIVAVMGSETMWSDVKHLANYGFKRQKQIQLAQLETKRSSKKITVEVN